MFWVCFFFQSFISLCSSDWVISVGLSSRSLTLSNIISILLSSSSDFLFENFLCCIFNYRTSSWFSFIVSISLPRFSVYFIYSFMPLSVIRIAALKSLSANCNIWVIRIAIDCLFSWGWAAFSHFCACLIILGCMLNVVLLHYGDSGFYYILLKRFIAWGAGYCLFWFLP